MFSWVHCDMHVDASSMLSYVMCIHLRELGSSLQMLSHSQPLTYYNHLDIARCSLLPSVDLGAKWQPINM